MANFIDIIVRFNPILIGVGCGILYYLMLWVCRYRRWVEDELNKYKKIRSRFSLLSLFFWFLIYQSIRESSVAIVEGSPTYNACRTFLTVLLFAFLIAQTIHNDVMRREFKK